MSLKAGAYSLNGNSGKVSAYTFKSGLLSKIAHDLLININNFKVDVDVPEDGFASGSLNLEVQTNSLKVVCAMKEGEQQPDTLKEKDIADIEADMGKKVLHPDKYPTASFSSKSIQENGDSYHVSGDLSLHGVTKPLEFDIDTSGGGLKGRFTIIQTDYGIKPFKAMMGTLKIKDEMDIGFDLSLS